MPTLVTLQTNRRRLAVAGDAAGGLDRAVTGVDLPEQEEQAVWSYPWVCPRELEVVLAVRRAEPSAAEGVHSPEP